MLDGNLEFSPGIPDSKIWFALEHPKVLFVPATCIHFLQLTDVLLYPVCFGLVHGIPFKIYVSFYLLGFILIYVAWISIHPNDVAQAEVRRSALTGLNMAVILSDNALDSKVLSSDEIEHCSQFLFLIQDSSVFFTEFYDLFICCSGG